jgi:hypothetical protein
VSLFDHSHTLATMDFTHSALLLVIGLFVGMLLSVEIGRGFGRATLRRNPDGLAQGIGAVEGAVYGLLGLIIAFSFSGAESRFEHRRQLLTEEANAIGTAWLRIDLLPEDAQPGMRVLFRHYLDSRLECYRNVEDVSATQAATEQGAALQGEIWSRSVAACETPGVAKHAGILVISSLNTMFDITTTRTTATRDHPPTVIFVLFALLSFVGSMLAGYNMSVNKKRQWFHTLAFTVILSLTVYVILDLEYPRKGLVRVDSADKVLVDLRQCMK